MAKAIAQFQRGIKMIAHTTMRMSRTETTIKGRKYLPFVRIAQKPNVHRRGVAAVELALISPIWLTLVLGIVEISQALRADAVLSAAARAACVTASLPGTANIDVIAEAKSVLTANGINSSSATVTILVNGSALDVASAAQYSKISVTVSMPTTTVVVVDMITFLKNKTMLSQSMTMIRQG